MREKLASPDGASARVASRQHGVITTAQLRASGLSDEGIGRRVRAGRLHRLHHGVYAVGHVSLSLEGRWMAAVLACGSGAALSHRAGAALLGLLPPAPGPIDVTIPGSGGRPQRKGIRIHRSRNLTRAQITRRRGIPVTAPARTIADLRRVLPGEQVRQAVRQCEVLGLPTGLESIVDHTRSELEHRFLAICRRHRLPMPKVNVPIGSYVVDFLWPNHALIAETDGYRFHRGALAFEQDRARDVELRMLGYDVVRFTFRQVAEDQARVAAALRTLLSGDGSGM